MDFPDRFVFHPNQKKGIYCYDGTPCPTKEIFERIGQTGIDEIHAQMQLMMEMRKKMYGCFDKADYGFSGKEIFYDLETATTIKLLADPPERYNNVELHSPEQLNNEGSYLMARSAEENMGKRAFKNHVQRVLEMDWGAIQRKEKIEEAVKQTKWLKANSVKDFHSALSD
jgi:hypothetical protein